ncbi:methionine-R-sulfoxide reductase B1-A-like isoform X2 [Cetorhinus maximus]
MAFCSFFGGEVYKDHFEVGIYVCSKCGHELFSSQAKYNHSSPWPAFTRTIHPDSLSKRKEDRNALKSMDLLRKNKASMELWNFFINQLKVVMFKIPRI